MFLFTLYPICKEVITLWVSRYHWGLDLYYGGGYCNWYETNLVLFIGRVSVSIGRSKLIAEKRCAGKALFFCLTNHTVLFYFNRTKVITAQIVYILHIKPKIEGKMPYYLLSRKGSNCYTHIIISNATCTL